MFIPVTLSTLFISAVYGFDVPEALVEVFQPQGLRVSIPDVEGIKLFAFHAKINEEMNGREGGTYSRDITKAKNGRWTFYDPTAKLKVGDTIYYWTYVDYFDGKNKLGYANDDNEFKVEQLLDKDTNLPSRGGSTTISSTSTSTTTTSTTERYGQCSLTTTLVNGEQTCSGKEIFSENFDNLNKNVWTTERKFAGAPDYEFVLYEDRPEVVKTENGFLRIKPHLTDDLYGQRFVKRSNGLSLGASCTGKPERNECFQKPDAWVIINPVVSGQISTKNKFSFRYGTIEIRAKLPEGNWIYPELYLTPAEEFYGSNDDLKSGQIRIAFLEGNAVSSALYGGCVIGKTQEARKFGMKVVHKVSGNWTSDFHTFKIYWAQDTISVSVDDKTYGNIYVPSEGFKSVADNLNLEGNEWAKGTPFAPFDREMYITLGVGVGGNSIEDRSDGSKPWKNEDGKAQKKFYNLRSTWKPTWGDSSQLQVDYVKVWAL